GEGRSVRRGELFVAAVVAGADNLGALVFHPTHPLVDADQRILERAAQVTALLLLFRRTVAEAEGQVRGELLDDLVSRPVRDPDLRKVLGRPVTAGASGPATGPDAVPAAYRDADRCVTALTALGRTGEGASTAELGYVGLLLGERRDVAGFIRDAIGPVVDYD